MTLKEVLWRRNLKQVYVATDLGIHPSRFSAFCNGYATPSAEQAERISAFLGVPVDDLFPPREKPFIEIRGSR